MLPESNLKLLPSLALFASSLKMFDQGLLLPEIFTWEVETFHFLSGLPFLVLPLTTTGGAWTTIRVFPILAPFHSSSFSFGHLLGGYFMHKKE